MKPIATNIADFETLRKEGLLYVDKTAHLHRLITKPGSTFFFCARPRRFGKSLSVTTLKSIFLGHREYFDGLAIAKAGYDWKPHAVIHFNWGLKALYAGMPYGSRAFDSKTRQLAMRPSRSWRKRKGTAR